MSKGSDESMPRLKGWKMGGVGSDASLVPTGDTETSQVETATNSPSLAR